MFVSAFPRYGLRFDLLSAAVHSLITVCSWDLSF